MFDIYLRDIALEDKVPWPIDDMEYTPSSSTLSAVWQVLRQDSFSWKVISDDVIRRYAYVNVNTAPDYDDYDCSAPEVLSCGETNVRYTVTITEH